MAPFSPWVIPDIFNRESRSLPLGFITLSLFPALSGK